MSRINLEVFPKVYRVINKTKRYPDPISEHDIQLLEQMGAEVIVDRQSKTVTILNKPFGGRKRSNLLSEKRKRFRRVLL